ncbi:hypothetical protein HanPI659440_Chr11g0431811 [Helianthus annuus]|nr:hypothetical protein HanPI659440_Chr11g0431811 [Helianthus annuus]
MHYRRSNEGIPKLPVVSYLEEQWYKTLSGRPTPMLQLDEMVLVTAGMSTLWEPTNPRGAPVYKYKNRAYGLMNALDQKVGGGMVTRQLLEGELPWLEQIKDYFLHPTEESLGAHVATPTGAHPLVSVKPKVMKSPARGGGATILLSSEGSTASSDGLIHWSRTTRTGPNVKPTGGSEADAHMEPVTADPEVSADELVQERPEVQTQPGMQTGKHYSHLRYLDYVVVSDTLSGLDVGVRLAPDEAEEDQVTITQILEKKRKILADAKRKLDTEATLNMSEKKRKLTGQPMGPAPSKSEVDLSVFKKKSGKFVKNCLLSLPDEKGSAGVTGSRSRRSTTHTSKPIIPDISSIPGPESPPAALFGESPVRDPVRPEDVKGKGPKGAAESVFVKKVQPSTLLGGAIRERVDGIETDVESSEATPLVTKYTRCIPSSGEGRGHSEGRGVFVCVR